MEWIYLSPHYDDVALSCGGLVWEQVRQGDAVTVWTICGGSPDPALPYSPFAQSLHARWQSGADAVPVRQAEDIASCGALGAGWRHFPLADCIYRAGSAGQHFYTSEEALWGALNEEETPLIQALAQTFSEQIPRGAQVICPLALGDHVDHKLVRAAAEQSGLPLRYYADFPYVTRPKSQRQLAALVAEGWRVSHFPVSRAGLAAWQAAIAAHRSQVSSFWATTAEMEQGMEAYWQSQQQGVRLLAYFA